jgi:molybdate transport system ATP-binding protein
MPCIVVSHDMADILHFTDNVLLLEAGRCVGKGTLGDLLGSAKNLDRLGEGGAINTLTVRVGEHDENGARTIHLTESGVTLISGLWKECPPGSRVVVGIRPAEIALALTPVDRISTQNQVRGTVLDVLVAQGRVACTVDIGSPVVVDVTARTVDLLGLRPGLGVTLLFKARAVRRVGPSPTDLLR